MPLLPRPRRLALLLLVLLATLPLQAAPLKFQVTVAPAVADQPLSGRLLFFMTAQPQPLPAVLPSMMDPRAVWSGAAEVRNLEPGKPTEVAPTVAFPDSFSAAPPGDYQVMALLDVGHTFSYFLEPSAADLRSEVVTVRGLNSTATGPIALTLTHRIQGDQPFSATGPYQLVNFESPALSAFWGRPITMHAVVLLPPSYARSPERRYPAVYVIHGFGWTHLEAARNLGPGTLHDMAKGGSPEMIYVYLDGHCPLGHHVFADSANNGPWGRALIAEFIPYLERKFRMDAVPRGRLLTGHSSGGWSSLWLEVRYPGFFGGTWSTSPDPEDFRSFTGIDLTRDPPENAYRKPDGSPRNVVRSGAGRELASVEELTKLQRVLGDYGGVFPDTFEAVFSPRGDDGRPMPLFDRDTGAIDPVVQKEWEKFDIARYLRARWKRLAPRLQGKIHVIVGTADNFHLEESARYLRDTLQELGSDATVTFLQGRTHFNLYQGGLQQRIAREMYAVARPGRKPERKTAADQHPSLRVPVASVPLGANP